MKSIQNSKNNNKKSNTDSLDTPIVYDSSNLDLPKEIDAVAIKDWERELLTMFMTDGNKSLSESANSLGIKPIAVALSMKTNKSFSKAYQLCRKIKDFAELMTLEKVSTTNAVDPKSVVERIFRLKSLDRERYADRGRLSEKDIEININFGNGVSIGNNAVKDTTPTIKDGEISSAKKTVSTVKSTASKDITELARSIS